MLKQYGERLVKWYGENAPNWWANPDTGPGPFLVFADENHKFLSFCSFIYSYRGRKSLKRINPVFHWKAWSDVKPVLRCTPRFGSQFATYDESSLDKTPPWSCIEEFSSPVDISHPMVLPLPVFQPDIDTVVDDAVREAVPSLNLLVSFVEAFDVPATMEGILRQGLSGEILRYNLAISPLIGEIQSIATRLGAWDDLISRVNRDLSEGFRAVDGKEFTGLTHVYIDSEGFRITVNYDVTYVFGVRVVGNIPPTTSYLERVGLNSTLGDTVWNLLPLSFVVDYVFPLGTFFTRPLVPNFVVTSSWTSTRIVGQFKAERLIGDSYRVCQTGNFESYERLPRKWDQSDGIIVDPNMTRLPSNWRQWANVAALARLFTSR